MRILHVYRAFFPDARSGVAETIRQISLSAARHGVESRVFTLSRDPRPPRLSVDGIEVLRVRQSFEIASCGFCLGGIRDFREQARWADLIHYHFPWPCADLLHMLARPGKPGVLTYHSDIVRQKALRWVYRPLMNRFLGRMSRIVATSPNYRATSDVLGRFPERVEIIPIGIERDSYPCPRANPAALESARREYGEGFFLFVGALRYYKGLHILLDAIRGADYRVVIAGSGPMGRALRARARQLGLDNAVFCGDVSDAVKMALFRLSRAVVFPSCLRSEAFGVTLLEGAMSGRPLISAEVGSGTSHVNIHDHTGLVALPGCPEALREAMDRMYRNPGRAREMGRNARRRYESLFTGKRMGARYVSVYRRALMEPGEAAELSGAHGR